MKSMLYFRSRRRTILCGVLAAGAMAAYLLAAAEGGITAFHPTGSEEMAMTGKSIDASLPGATETATFALG